MKQLGRINEYMVLHWKLLRIYLFIYFSFFFRTKTISFHSSLQKPSGKEKFGHSYMQKTLNPRLDSFQFEMKIQV